MNVVKEIQRLNDRELELGLTASWHDQYKDSAHIFVGGLPYQLTEGDVLTIFSQYGEIADINMPRDKTTGKPRGFAFLLYEDQRSTVLAVDNLNGASVLNRTLRVDHVQGYTQPKVENEEGDFVEAEEERFNARWKPENDAAGGDAASSDDSLDEEDPMAAYIREQKRLAAGGGVKESKDEQRARKAARREKRERKRKGRRDRSRERERERSPPRRRDRSREREREVRRDPGRNRSPRREDDRRRGYDERDRDGERRRDYERDRR